MQLPLWLQAWKNIRKAKQAGNVSEHNSVGDGWLMGGTMVIGQGSSGIFLSYLESTYGDTASVQEVRDLNLLYKLSTGMLSVLHR